MIEDSVTTKYYAELPNNKVAKINWVEYELLLSYGWVHRILTADQAILHKIRGKK
jgi:hypothetical protein